MRAVVRLLLVATVLFGVAGAAQASTITIGSLAGGRTFTGPDWDNLRAALLDPANFGAGGINPNDVVIAAATATIDAATLAGYQMFVINEASLTGAQATALANWVQGGGRLVISTESNGGGAAGANAVLALLDGSSVVGGSFGVHSATGGTILASGLSSNGLFGNLVGGTFGTSLGNSLIAGGSSTVIGSSAGTPFLLETLAGAGAVLTAADVLFMDFFVPPAGALENANNGLLFLNFVPGGAAVPEPATVGLLGLGMLAAGWARRHRTS